MKKDEKCRKNNNVDVSVKKVMPHEMQDAVRLIAEVFTEFEAPCYTAAGIQFFFDNVLHSAEFLSGLTVYGAYRGDKLTGVIATRKEGTHISLFFVDGKYHRRGIGKKLFHTVLQACAADSITVHSSLFAQEVYRRLGFTDTGAEQESDGIRFIPMIYKKQL